VSVCGASITRVLHSQPEDFIGGGRDYDLTYTRPGDIISAGFLDCSCVEV